METEKNKAVVCYDEAVVALKVIISEIEKLTTLNLYDFDTVSKIIDGDLELYEQMKNDNNLCDEEMHYIVGNYSIFRNIGG